MNKLALILLLYRSAAHEVYSEVLILRNYLCRCSGIQENFFLKFFKFLLKASFETCLSALVFAQC
jgi:hypothetical protein